MSIGARWWVLLALSVGCDNAMAVLAIEGTVVIEPSPTTLLRGQTATLTYMLTNTGDEPLDFAAAGVSYFETGPTSTVLPEPTAATPPCDPQFLDLSPLPGQPVFVINSNAFNPTPIAPGDSRLCVMNLVVSPEAAGPFVVQFSFVGLRGAAEVNTAQEVLFTLGTSAAVPVLEWPSMALLVLLISLMGARLLRR